MTSMSSTLVETVSIDYEDFNESFLTCGTCLCVYDAEEHTPKILPCSHTVCRSCLVRIVDAQGVDSSFRCPICRETIAIPRGGVISLPPSFIVNQLLDLMARQRRDIIPKCSVHPSQELMFCETCDTVFCMDCTGGSHNGRGASAHTVIPFSIAIKRMSEILLYKASLCMRHLTAAGEAVSEELVRLEESTEACLQAVNDTFQELLTSLDQRRHDLLCAVRNIHEQKHQALQEQLDIIEAEKGKVHTDCQGLQLQVEVRNITKKISDLNEKLDVSSTLAEPRENAFMRFEYKHNDALNLFARSLEEFGRVKISTTFPALCTARIQQAITHLKTSVLVTMVDYHGNPRTTGSDPLTADLVSDCGSMIPLDIYDHDNGTYTIHFTPKVNGLHTLSIRVFDRAIRDSPFHFEVSDHNNPVARLGQRGSGCIDYIQPVSAVLDNTDGILYVLDTGNSRVKLVDSETGRFLRHLGPHGLEQHSGTGMAVAPNGNLVLVNWRTKHVTELSPDNGDVIYKFTCSDFIEPISVTVNRHGDVIVADNGAGKLFVFDSDSRLIHTIGSKGDGPGQFRLISMVYSGPNDEVYVVDNRIQVFSRSGKFLHEISTSSSGSKVKGQYGGVVVDCHGRILASRTEKGKSVVQVFNAQRQLLFNIDSNDDKLKRPSGLATTHDGRVFVVDLGNDCIKKFRYQ